MTKTEFHVQNALRELAAARGHVENGELDRAFSRSSERFAFRGDISDVVSRATVFLENIHRASQSDGTDSSERRMADSLDETAHLLAQVRKLVRMVELEFPTSPVKLVKDPDGT